MHEKSACGKCANNKSNSKCVTTSYTGVSKDSILKNNAKITTNLLPVSYLTIYFKWQDLIVGPKYEQKVDFNVYSTIDGSKLYTLPYLLNSISKNDSTSLFLTLPILDNPVGQSFGYEIRATYKESAQTETVLAISNSWGFSIIDDPNKVYNNVICCSEVVTLPFIPTKPLTQDPNAGNGTQTTTHLPIKYVWQKGSNPSSFSSIPGATNASYLSPRLIADTYYRRVAIAYSGSKEISYSFSNIVSIARQTCTRPAPNQNAICGDQVFYNLKHGDTIYPSKIIGTEPNYFDKDRQRAIDFSLMSDGEHWHSVSRREYFYEALSSGRTDYQMNNMIFDINQGAVQYIYIKRDYYELYDDWSCGFFGHPFPCGEKFYLKSTSNIVKITLTSFDKPKAPPTSITNESFTDFVDCAQGGQVKTFSVPRLNNGELYLWEIPSAWTSYSTLLGPYANSITINTNSAGANYGIGGNVCLTIAQPGQTNKICTYIRGSEPFRVSMPATITACEGQTVLVNPVVLVNNVAQNPYDYTFNWEAYQTPDYSCSNIPNKYDPDCKGLKINVSNVYQNKNQPIKVTVLNENRCIATASTVLTTTPGLQMGILYSYDDPKALSTSTLAPDTINNYLYFVNANKNIECAYFDNAESIWKYNTLKNKINNTSIESTGSVKFYKSNTSKLFYTRIGNLYYAESLDNGNTWIDYFTSGSVINYIDNRFQIFNDNIYYINSSDRKVYYKPIANTNAPAVLVGNIPVNYSQNMFEVDGGIVAYADQNNNIIAFDALTGATLPINVAANLKAVAYNSTIAIFNKNIYYVSSSPSNTLRILQKSSMSSSYVSSQDAATQLAGPFTINKQTGTVYAKAYDVAGKQIYFLNNQWNSSPIKNYIDAAPIQSAMVYANNHAYYISTNGLVSNTFYVAPCSPAVLRTANAFNNISGDIQNEPIPIVIEETKKLILYPNPASDFIHVHVTLENSSNLDIKIISVTGEIDNILINKSFEEGSHDIQLPVMKYPAGIYIVQLYLEGELTASTKLIKY